MDWLLDDFVKSTPGVLLALVTSGDGLRLARSGEVSAALADSLSAAVCGMASLARGAAGLLDAEPVNQTIVEMATGYLFASSVGDGSTLVVFTERQCDMGMVGYEMTMLANQVGHALSPAARNNGIPAAAVPASGASS
ncbi:MAG TPA: roadblock/LC7 domain-containing protein [Pseudonocardia sp.]|jgi:predicted regulator of Ras-like GTPase activity (Roadblock/LC7/MglB family)|nr:roadblock/LC7 domain-containing protein [Pseudonocardia sp.]